MALFKILRGESSRIDTNITPFHNGYAYLTPDDGGFYIDAEINGIEKRIHINSLEGVVKSEELKTHIENYANPHGVTAVQTGAATAIKFETTLLASDWTGSEAPYTITTSVEGVLETDTPIVDTLQSDDEEINESIINAWSLVNRMISNDGTITAYAIEKPEVDIPIHFLCVRGNGQSTGGNLYAPAIQRSVFGSLATVTDAAALPALSAVVMIEPMQAGEGDPYLPGDGKNLLKYPYSTTITEAYGLNFNDYGDGRVGISGTATQAVSFVFADFTAGNRTELKPGTYTFSGNPSNFEMSIYVYDSQETSEIDSSHTVKAGGSVTFTIDSIRYYGAYVRFPNDETIDVILSPQLEIGSTATEYKPYSNIRSITGHEGCEMRVTRKNLLKYPYFTSNTGEHGLTFEDFGDGRVGISGTATEPTNFVFANFATGKRTELKAGTYTFSGNPSDALLMHMFVYGSQDAAIKDVVYSIRGGETKTFTIDSTKYCGIYARVSSGATVDVILSPQLEISSAATEYEPYQVTTYQAAFPQTVYGGSYDFVTGKLTVDRDFIESYAGETLPGKWNSSMDVYSEGTTPTTGAQVCYELATPLTYDLTPQRVDMLFGLNNIWNNTVGGSKVVYIADTKTYIDNAPIDDISTWKGIQKAVRDGVAQVKLPVGTQLAVNHSKYGTCLFDVVAHNYLKSASDEEAHTMTLQQHDLLSSGVQFDSPEALYYVEEEELSAGTYNFTIIAYDQWVAGTYQFTLTQSVPIGGQLCVSGQYPHQGDIINAKIYSYASQTTTTAIESVAITAGSEGTSLGTCGSDSLNHTHRIAYGSNNYKESAIRQFLNSSSTAGNVWIPQTKFDRPPSWVNSLAGYQNGLDEDFLAVIGRVKLPCSANDAYEGPESTITKNTSYTLNDKFYLASRAEIFGTHDVADGSTLFPYYVGASNTDRIKYQSVSASYWWLRTSNAWNVGHARLVAPSGSLSSDGTYFARGIAPACTIV